MYNPIRLSRFRSQSGQVMIFVLLGIMSIVYFVFIFIIDWIYDTKEDRIRQDMEYYFGRKITVQEEETRGPGGYEVVFHPTLQHYLPSFASKQEGR